jgi:hypothetical protein
VRGRLIAAAALAVASSGAGCSGGKGEYTGIGPYRVGHTTLRDAKGRCEPTDLPDGRKGTWCYLQPELQLAGRPATVDLYFLGTTPDAPVIEIQLQVVGCEEDALGLWLRKNFGAPSEERLPWAAWKTTKLFLIAMMPSDPGRCMLRVLPKSEAVEFERLRAKLNPT